MDKGTHFSLFRYWIQLIQGRSYWVWLKAGDEGRPVTVKIYRDTVGRVRVIRAIGGY